VALVLAVIGPGIITANVDNDAGGITTYSLAGAQFGYALLWTLIPITVALIVVQEMCARMGVMTGKGLADLIREQYGVKTTFYIMVALLVADLGNTVAEFAGVAASLEIFGVSKYLSIPGAALFVWWLVVYGTYRRVEKVFLVSCVFYVAYIISGVLARPPWGVVLTSLVVPEFSWRGNYLTMLIGVVGTTIAPWMQFYLQSAVVEKGIRPAQYRYCYHDVIVGCIVTNVVAMFIIVACAVTLFEHHIPIQTAQDAALALRPLAGRYCAGLFAFGLFNASLFAASILPLATAHYVCEGFGWETGIDKKFREAPQFFGLYTALIALGSVFILIPRFPLVAVMYLSQVVNGMLLPFVLIVMLLLVNRRDLMGEHVNSRTFNVIAWAASIIMIVLTVAMIVSLLLG
jgi:NRAMP (natural resistance-associated macrophage protein)-like metal ion transporter